MLILERRNIEAGEMITQQLKVPAALAEDLDSIPSPHGG